MTDPSPTPPRWRDEAPTRDAAATFLSVPRRVFLVLALLLAVAGVLAGVLSWARPRPLTYFVPLGVADHAARQLPRPPWAARDQNALLEGGYFVGEGGAAVRDRAALVSRLASLKGRRPDEAVLLYVSGQAVCDDAGRVVLLPGDADPDRLADGLPLRAVLEELRDCPARHKLLVLDVARPLADPRLGVLVDDASARVPAELEEVPDAHRLALCACAPGQVALASEDLGRTAFGYYFEEGLRGWSAPAASARVTVKDLARYVQTHVDRWAQRNRGVRQTPLLLGDGGDFALVALRHGKPAPHQEAAPPAEYPAWLLDAWKGREKAWAEAAYRTAPRAFRRLDALLLAAEADWRGGADAATLQRERLAELTPLTERLKQGRTVPHPEPRSLALAAALGARPDAAVAGVLRDFFKKPAVPAKPGEPDKALADLIEALKPQPHLDVASAAFAHLAANAAPAPEKVRLLDDVLRAQESEPRFVETLFLRRLADLARQSGPAEWPAASVRKALEVVRLGERAAARPRSFAWVAGRLEGAARLRHDGETVLLARGYAPLVEADRLLTQAEEDYRLVLDVQDAVEAAQDLHDEALVFLPPYRAFLEQAPAGEGRWLAAVASAEALGRALGAPPTGLAPRDELAAKRNELETETRRLRSALDDLARPFGAEEVRRLIEASKQPEANGALVREIDALLAAPHLAADARLALWKAGRDLARRLLDETLALDEEEGQAKKSEEAPPEYRQDWDAWEGEQRTRAARRAVAAARLLRLGGVRLAEPLRDLAAPPDEDLRPGAPRRAALSDALRRAWTTDLRTLVERATDPAALDRLSRIFPPLDAAPTLDDPDQPAAAVRLRTREAAALWTWLFARYRHASQDADAAPFFAAAAHDYGRLATRLPGPSLRLRGAEAGPDLSPSRRSGIYDIQVELLDAGAAKPETDVSVLGADDEWLDVVLDVAALALLKADLPDDAAPVARVPVAVSLKPDAERAQAPPPRGFLVRARVEGRSTFLRVPVPLGAVRDRLETFLSADPKAPTAPLTELRLRPGPERQRYYLYVRNPGDRARAVLVELRAGDRVFLKPLTLPPRETVNVTFPPPPPAAGTPPAPAAAPKQPLEDLTGPLTLRVLDAGRANAVVLSRELGVAVAPPREYVRVAGIRFDPPGPKTGGKNRLEMTLRAAALAGPPVVAELTVLPDDDGGAMPTLTGTLRGALPADGTDLKLFAEAVPEPARGDEVRVGLTVDGVERAFVFRAPYPRRGEPVTPREDDEPALRLRAAPFGVSAGGYSVRTEVDNEPHGAALEISLGSLAGSAFEATATRKHRSGRDARVGFGLAPDGSLLFEAALRDWKDDLDVGQVRGRRTLRARLLDADGQALRTAYLPVVLDDRKPDGVRFVDLPPLAKSGTSLTVKAVGRAEVAGIKEVQFFVGAPADGKPPAGAVAGAPAGEGGAWAAKLTLPEKKGPVELGVRFVTGVGLGEFGKATLELVDFDPEKTAPGRIDGVVLAGDIPQGGLDVVLKDDKGAEKAKAKTKADGSFAFEGVAPGTYKVTARKPTSAAFLKGGADAKVEPGGKTAVKVELFL